MKFIFEQKEFIKILENVYKAIDSMNVFLPLRNFYLTVKEEEIIFVGSNGNLSIKNTFSSKPGVLHIELIGECLIPSSLFINIIRKCSGKIEIQQKENILFIKNELDTYEVNLLNIEDYPSIDFDLYGTKININSLKLKEGIKNVIFASSQKEDELILNGVNLKLNNKKLILTATDSYRLAQEEIEIEDDRNLSFDVTVHNKNLKDFIPNEINDDITLYVNDYKINLVCDNFIIQSKIIDAPYKDVSRIFETKFNKKISIERSVFSNAISKATVIVGDSYNKIRLEVNQNEMKIISVKDEVGNSKVILSSNKFKYEGDDVFITLNFKYLKEAINVFNNMIEVNLNNPEGIILITDGKEKNKNRQIISPLRSY